MCEKVENIIKSEEEKKKVNRLLVREFLRWRLWMFRYYHVYEAYGTVFAFYMLLPDVPEYVKTLLIAVVCFKTTFFFVFAAYLLSVDEKFSHYFPRWIIYCK